MRYLITLATLLILSTTVVYAQICETFMLSEEEIAQCEGLSADELCFIAGNIKVTPRSEGEALIFAQPGDTLSLASVASLELSSDAVVSLNLRANPTGENLINALASGAIRIDFLSAPTLRIPLTLNSGANLRSGAGTGFATVGGLQAGNTVDAIGQNAAGDWFFIDNGAGLKGWVFATLVTPSAATSSLPVLADDASAALSGMNIPVLNVTPIGDISECGAGKLLLQTPSGSESEIIINNAFMQIGSSVVLEFLRAQSITVIDEANEILEQMIDGTPPSADLIMRAQTLQGRIRVTAFLGVFDGFAAERALEMALQNAYQTVFVPAGTEGLFLIDQTGEIVAQPIVLPYDQNQVTTNVESIVSSFELAYDSSDPITIAPAPSLEEVRALFTSAPANDGIYSFNYSRAFFPGVCRDNGLPPTNPNYNGGSFDFSGNIRFLAAGETVTINDVPLTAESDGDILLLEATTGTNGFVGNIVPFTRTSPARYSLNGRDPSQPIYIDFDGSNPVLTVVYTVIFVETATNERTVQCYNFENHYVGRYLAPLSSDQ